MFVKAGCSRSRLCKWVAIVATVASGSIVCAADAGTPPATQPTTSEGAGAAAKATVSIDNFKFTPATLTVAPGTTVTWVNHDDVPHTVTSRGDPQVFDSGALDTDDKFSFTFSKSGNYAYYCKVHTHMKGVVTVK